MADLFGWQSEYLAMLEDCEVRVADLDDWERQFVQSLRGQFDRPSFTPSPRQVEKLEAIWEKVTA